MNSYPARRRAYAAVGAVLITVSAMTAACGTKEKESPSSTTTPTTTTTSPPATTPAPPSPTEKQINPTGGNLFTPSVIAPPAPTQPPGVHRNGGTGGEN